MPFRAIGPMELAIVLLIVLVLLGPRRLPETGRSLGRGLREFSLAVSGRQRGDGELPGDQ